MVSKRSTSLALGMLFTLSIALPITIISEPAFGDDDEDTEVIIEHNGVNTSITGSSNEEPQIPGEQTEKSEEWPGQGFSYSVDKLWAEFGVFLDDSSRADTQGYLHAQASAHWTPNSVLEIKAAGRIDGYYQWGDLEADDLAVDYGESFLRYTASDLRLTVGAQSIIWGRIDELPPTDHLSTQDLSRYILDELDERRRASPVARLEYFAGNAKLDVMALPFFREAELPEKDSVWFPIDKRGGEVLGLESTPQSRDIVRNSRLVLDAPNSEGGFGFRFSSIASRVDYSVTAQKGRQTVPYFVYDPAREVLESRYPRSWLLGGDLGFEALGGTVRLETAWLSDTPVTTAAGMFSTVESVRWGAALELFPGDGDARLNLQLTGTNLLDAPAILDREEIYAFNGTYDTPMPSNDWRFKLRFYTGIDKRDLYVNPEISYQPLPSHTVYLAGHYFDGSDGTPGGFHDKNSLITIGWNAHF